MCDKIYKKLTHYSQDHASNALKYLLYDVNPSEGFNLRRDVYIRMANLVNNLNNKYNRIEWILVLPPWNNLVHWKNRQELDQTKIDWSHFFDVKSLQTYAPVIELKDLFYMEKKQLNIDLIYYLKTDLSDLNRGEFNKFSIADHGECSARWEYFPNSERLVAGPFWTYYDEISAKYLNCVLFRGSNFFLAEKIYSISQDDQSLRYLNFKKRFAFDRFLLYFLSLRYLMIDRAETLLHQNYGDLEYWNVSRMLLI